MRLALLGKPGAGKSTQGSILAGRLGIPFISTGALLRRRAAADDAEASRLADALERGELVDDDLVVSALNDAIGAAGTGRYLLDGFPRTLAQARRRDAPPVDLMINLDVPDDVARRRLAQRASAGRADDAARAVMERRLRLFHTETEPVLDFYRRHGTLETVDATQPPDAVTEAALRAVGRARAGRAARPGSPRPRRRDDE